MNRLFKTVAVVILGIVAVQPALAGLLCHVPASPCPVAITDMGPSCGMVSQAASVRSPFTSSVRAIFRSSASVALPATQKAPTHAIPAASFEAIPEPHPALFTVGRGPAEASSPPIYIRNRVFRI